MHDKNGTELKKGDEVIIHAIVEEIYPTQDYCNVTLKSLYPRKPDGIKETLTINTAVTILHSKG